MRGDGDGVSGSPFSVARRVAWYDVSPISKWITGEVKERLSHVLPAERRAEERRLWSRYMAAIIAALGVAVRDIRFDADGVPKAIRA